MICHLLKLTQAKLAYCTKLAPAGATEHEASIIWRNKVATMDPEAKVAEATALIIKNRDEIDKPATDTLIASGALQLIVNNKTLRLLENTSAHPGGPTSTNSSE